MKIFKIKVFQDESRNPVIYVIRATNEMDARTIAFCLDGGFAHSMVKMKDSHIELVKTYTEVVE